MIRLESLRCAQGCLSIYLSLNFGTWGHIVSAGSCGGPYRSVCEVSPSEVPGHLRHRIQEILAELCAEQRIDRDEVEHFLGQLFMGH